jgi:hypothetical protein
LVPVKSKPARFADRKEFANIISFCASKRNWVTKRYISAQKHLTDKQEINVKKNLCHSREGGNPDWIPDQVRDDTTGVNLSFDF